MKYLLTSLAILGSASGFVIALTQTPPQLSTYLLAGSQAVWAFIAVLPARRTN